MHVGEKEGVEILVCTVGKTILHYDIRYLNDLYDMLKAYGDWMLLGSKDQMVAQKRIPWNTGGVR